ncbi:MAG: hypothetical protein H0U95_12650 [Bacteroidetes bacterium]|nr:hypothetical protein [Bacteroidota bacterium]
METVNNLKSLFVSILLIVAGLISPSNGVDDRSYKTPLEILSILTIVVVATTLIYLISILVEKQSETKKSEN